MKIRFLNVIVMLVLLMSTRTAWSQQHAGASSASSPDVEARAAALKETGDRALEAKRFEDALAAYDEAYVLAPMPVLLFNRGRALQFLARYPEALGMIEQFASTAPPELLAKVPGLPALLADLRVHVSVVLITCTVSGARISLDKKQIATTPVVGSMRVSSGKHVLEVFADGYFPYQRDVDLPGGGTTTLDVTLTSRDTSGLLAVRSTVSAVNVQVDEKRLGVTPVEVGLPPGTHKVFFDKDGYEASATQIVLAAGERKTLMLAPTLRKPLYAKWWFWTGVAVIAAGVALAVILVTTEGPAPSGDFQPGQVYF